MKKSIIALAIPALLAAGAANAAINLYDADGVTVDLGAAIEIQYAKPYNEATDAYLRVDDADLFFNTQIKVTDQLAVIGAIGFRFENDRNNTGSVFETSDVGTTESDELWVGFATDYGRLTYGRQLLIADGAGNDKDYEFGFAAFFDKTAANQVIKYMYDNGGMFYGGLSIMLDDNISKQIKGNQSFDGLLGTRYAGLDVRIYAFKGENFKTTRFAPDILTGGTDTVLQDVTGYDLEANYNFGNWDLAASYGFYTYEHKAALSHGKNDVSAWQVSGSYKIDDRTTWAAGYGYLTSKPTDAYVKYEASSLYTNVTYQMHNNARIYAELGLGDVEIDHKDQNLDFGYVLGMEVAF